MALRHKNVNRSTIKGGYVFKQYKKYNPISDVLIDLQANILIPQKKKYTFLLSIRLSDENAHKKNQEWLTSIALHLGAVTGFKVTSALDQMLWKYNIGPETKATDYDEKPIMGIYLSRKGAAAVGVIDEDLPKDAAFKRGMYNNSTTMSALHDYSHMTEWESNYKTDIHILILVANNYESPAQDFIALVEHSLKTDATGEVLNCEKGIRLNGAKEHFGFKDGISQPNFWHNKSFKEFVNISENLIIEELDHVLVRNAVFNIGSYLVFRKLEQNVAAFRKRVEEIENKGVSKEYAEAQIIGRYKSGEPLSLFDRPVGQGPMTNNLKEKLKAFNFFKKERSTKSHYDQLDAQGLKCPFHAHIRKVNPRNDDIFADDNYPDIPQDETSPKVRMRIVRRGVPYGKREFDLSDAPSNGVGIMFLSFQASIECQFEKIHSKWIHRPDFPHPNTGYDPLVGRPGYLGNNKLNWNKEYGKPNNDMDMSTQFINEASERLVTVKGGGYFFAPSISFFRELRDKLLNVEEIV